jgi:hypothetical protein
MTISKAYCDPCQCHQSAAADEYARIDNDSSSCGSGVASAPVLSVWSNLLNEMTRSFYERKREESCVEDKDTVILF